MSHARALLGRFRLMPRFDGEVTIRNQSDLILLWHILAKSTRFEREAGNATLVSQTCLIKQGV